MLRKTFPLFLFSILPLVIFSPVVEAKPRPPLRLTFHHQNLSGGEIQLTFKAKANIASDQVNLFIDLPPGISIIEGEAAWEGPLNKGETQKIEVTILNPGSLPLEITGRATMQFTGGGGMTQENKLVLNAPEEEHPPTPDPITRKKGGETILEFRGK